MPNSSNSAAGSNADGTKKLFYSSCEQKNATGSFPANTVQSQVNKSVINRIEIRSSSSSPRMR